jgi:hypothetical protein
MKKPKHSRNVPVVAVGLAWYDREQWTLLCEFAADRSKLDDTYEEWEANAHSAIADLKSRGVLVEPVEILVANLVKWCAEHKLHVDSAARAQYASHLLRLKHAKA